MNMNQERTGELIHVDKNGKNFKIPWSIRLANRQKCRRTGNPLNKGRPQISPPSKN